MLRKIESPIFIFIFFALISVIFSTSSLGADKQTGQAHVFKIEQITKEQFGALPDNAMVEFKGKHMTKGQFIAELQEVARQNIQRARSDLSSKSTAALEAERTKFLQQGKQRIAADNAKTRAEFERLKLQASSAKARRISAIRQEALQLNNKSKKATTAELEKIEKRAGELIQELKQLGYGGEIK